MMRAQKHGREGGLVRPGILARACGAALAGAVVLAFVGVQPATAQGSSGSAAEPSKPSKPPDGGAESTNGGMVPKLPLNELVKTKLPPTVIGALIASST